MQKVVKSCYRICDILYLATKTNQIREVTFYEEEIIKLTSGNGYGCYELAGCGSNGGQQATTPATDNKTETSAEAKTDASTTTTTDGGKIGVAMPTKDLQRWNQDGTNMEAQLKEAGYEVDLQYASNDIPTQVSQIENMINSGCQMLVIASIDGDSLGTVLEQAKEKDIPVIAYDRLIMNSDAVTYYATFDNYMVGTKQGEYIRDSWIWTMQQDLSILSW